MHRLLFVEDNQRIIQLIQSFLKDVHEIKAEFTETYALADKLIKQKHYAGFILDIILPDGNGLDLINTINETQQKKQQQNPRITSQTVRSIQVPKPFIILLTTKSSIEDKERGFKLGINDYLPKPFHPKELILRIKNILRQQEAQKEQTQPALKLDLKSQTIHSDKAKLLLSRTEALILQALSHQSSPITAPELAQTLCEEQSAEISEQAIRIAIHRINNKATRGFGRKIIRSRYGVGYFLG